MWDSGSSSKNLQCRKEDVSRADVAMTAACGISVDACRAQRLPIRPAAVRLSARRRWPVAPDEWVREDGRDAVHGHGESARA